MTQRLFGSRVLHQVQQMQQQVAAKRAPPQSESITTGHVIQEAVDLYDSQTLTDGDTTPSVATTTAWPKTWCTNNSSPTTITDLDDGYEGQVVFLCMGDSNTTISGVNILLSSGTTVVTVTADYAISRLNEIVLVDTSGGNVTVTLPAASSTKGRSFHIKKKTTDVYTLTITALSGNIDGSATQVIALGYDALKIASDGTNYWII